MLHCTQRNPLLPNLNGFRAISTCVVVFTVPATTARPMSMLRIVIIEFLRDEHSVFPNYHFPLLPPLCSRLRTVGGVLDSVLMVMKTKVKKHSYYFIVNVCRLAFQTFIYTDPLLKRPLLLLSLTYDHRLKIVLNGSCL